MDARRIVFVIFPKFQVLDLTGPHEVFAQAEQGAQAEQVEQAEQVARTERVVLGYRLEVVAPLRGPVAASGGLTVTADLGLDECVGPIDTLVVVGGPGRVEACADRRLIGWLRAAAGRARRVAAVCSGAFLLAEAGLLDGRRAVTHWGSCAELARRYPAVTVQPDPIFVRDGAVWTSAGVTAGIDLALALVEQDRGAEASRRSPGDWSCSSSVPVARPSSAPNWPRSGRPAADCASSRHGWSSTSPTTSPCRSSPPGPG